MSPCPDRVSCWLCGSNNTSQISNGIDPSELTAQHFAITDSHYGKTLTIHQCNDCSFRFCPQAGDVTCFYDALEDQEYENTRDQRSLQAERLIHRLRPFKKAGDLVDIGAGTGIFVEQAQLAGYRAIGIEPGKWLAEQAIARSIPVKYGLFPDIIDDSKFDIITVIDVIEHVSNPLKLLQDIAAHLNSDGIAVIVTPDVGSLAARIMGKKWWHYRVAHISYFERKTLKEALEKAGMEAISWHRPAWFFPLDYLFTRLGQYIPFISALAKLPFAKHITVPLNLYDSWLIMARKQP
jgi:2-polyprenyl-3-methyl-5-hydroxy-6-metoxy-1,4-benzoquinol methylase